MTFFAVQPLGTQLAHQLRLEILSGRLEKDHHVVEAHIAETFGVSRGPVREALKELERDGLVYSARQGYRVAQLTSEDVEEMYTIRLMIERVAIERTLGTGQSWAQLESICLAMARAAERGDQAEFARQDLAFHRTFCEVGGGQRLQAVWRLFEPTLRALFEINPHPAHNLLSHAQEHARLCASLQSGTQDWRELLDEHLQRARRRFLREISQAEPRVSSVSASNGSSNSS